LRLSILRLDIKPSADNTRNNEGLLFISPNPL